MCLNCGCGMPEDAMNDKRNITLTPEQIKQAAEANGMTYNQTIDTIIETLRTMKVEE
ncbi:hypothetical protein HY030_01565 [Candidatus Gottesmanbacteria bacterium]|nr:hypothetical protein [Candidatus Gottesmanbacteria bacterium]